MRATDPIQAEPITDVAPALRRPILMNQEWRDLTYVHWPVPPERVQHLMPPGVRPDVHDGVTYVGLVPFRMVGAGFGARASVPYFGDFLETNIRLYSVDATGRRGVVFLSLDCERLAVVLGARLGFAVPYRWARMRHETVIAGDRVRHRYWSQVYGNGANLDLEIEVGEPKDPSPLDLFLSARWGLHTSIAGRTLYVPNEHPPWPLHAARILRLDGTLLARGGFADLATLQPVHVAFSPGVRTEFGLPGLARRPRAARAAQ